jgi:putative ABC transport system substrate-binding protein
VVPDQTRRSRRRLLHAGLALVGLSLGSGCGALQLPGQQPAKIPRIGYLGTGSRGNPDAQAFLAGLAELGYVEGRNLVIEWRFADSGDVLLPRLVAELLALPLDLLLAAGPVATRTATAATSTLPIVMCFPGDPIGLGLIASLDHPGGNVTGLASLTTELHAKRLELFAAALPGRSRLAVLWDVNTTPSVRGPLSSAGRALGLDLDYREVRGPDELAGAVDAAAPRRAEALFAAESSMFTTHRGRIADLAAAARLPVTGAGKAFAEVGALLSYGPRLPDMYRRAAVSVDKILKGAKPADLPVERPYTFDFVINLKTAQALGLTIPPSVLQQATEVIR